MALCHIGLVKDHDGHVTQPHLSLFEVWKNNSWRSNKQS